MKRSNKLITFSAVFVLCLLILLPISSAQDKISPEDAHQYIGKTKTVCGAVASTFYSDGSRGRPTFLNLNRPYPNQIFTVVIWGSDRGNFESPPEILYRDRRICVTGVIDTYKGKPQIIVHDPSQISIEE